MRQAKRSELVARVKELELLLCPDSQEVAKEYCDCKQDLESIYNHITEGVIMRSKTDRYKYGKS